MLRPLVLLGALALGGCAQGVNDTTWWNPLGLGEAPVSPPPATGVVLPARPADPLAAFAGRAQPGQMETVALPDSGRVVTVQLARTYNAGSGRECRELQFGNASAPGGAPGALYCNDPRQGWVAARPLLRGGAVARP
ncbi:DVU3141 family protein [Muricoccus radiodurans]|uniref:DVU3141 family protein n=1 Tax=Muricoccus radiodurans TaxID=2231721 RepID=UPI003CF91003